MIDTNSLITKNFEEQDKNNIKDFLQVINSFDGLEVSVSDEMIEFVLKNDFMRKNMFLTYLGEKLIAYSACAIHDNDKEKANFELLVHPYYRGNGIGSLLYNSLCDMAVKADIKRVRCGTKERMGYSMKFIKDRGFEPYQYMWSMDKELTPQDAEDFIIDGFTFSKFTDEEIADYTCLMNSGFKKEGDKLYNDKSFEHLLRDSQAYVFFIKKDGRPAATAAVKMQENLGRGYIQNVTVLNEFRGQKLGEMLIRHCLSYTKKTGMNKASLSVHGQNENALGLYKKIGFKEMDTEISFMKVL